MLQDLYRSVLCNINAGSITLHEALHDGIVALTWDYRLMTLCMAEPWNSQYRIGGGTGGSGGMCLGNC